MNILALDISTTAIGWSIFKDDSLIQSKTGTFSFPKSVKRPYEKLDVAKFFFLSLCKEESISTLVVEEALKKFAIGKTNAHTMNLLICFNFCLCYSLWAALENSLRVESISLIHARSLTGIKFLKGSTSQEKKELIRKYCENKYSSLKFPITKTGNFKPICYDMTDSIIIGEAFVKDRKSANLNSSISKPVKKKVRVKK